MSQLPKLEVIRLVVFDEYPIVLDGMCLRVSQERDMIVVGVARTWEEAAVTIERDSPSAIVTDLSHSDAESGLNAIHQIHLRDPDLPILVFSAHDETFYAEKSLRLGARGYLMKSAPIDDLIEAIRSVAAGKIYLSEAVEASLIDQTIRQGERPTGSASSLAPGLSPREFEVFELIGTGQTSKEIGATLGICLKTVETHRAHIKEKLCLEAGANLIQFAVRWFAADPNR